MQAMASPLDVCIRGGGIVGRTLALLLARDRLRVGLVDAAPAASTSDTAPDVRAYALNRASQALLEGVRCWPEPSAATPVTRMQVWGDGPGEVRFDATEFGTEALAWIVDVPVMEQLLRDAVRFQPQIQVLAAPAPARLTVVCEGRTSRTRAEFGVDFEVLPYAQHALAARLQCALLHGQVARQWFAEGEIVALLPMGGTGGTSVALVWSVSPQRAAELQQLSAEDFCLALQAATHHTLGELTLTSERMTWPLQKAQARQWSGRNAQGAWVLAGDAAHNVHPLAGQGLNLGLADLAQLAQLLHTRDYWRGVDDTALLRRYERSRKAGMLAIDHGMDGLQLLFAREGEPWRSLRNWGMNAVQRSGPLRQWLARRAMDF